MTVEITTGNLFESGCHALVNTINCVGVMGGGIAKAFRDKFPNMFDEYKLACKRGEVKLGKMHVWADHNAPYPVVINFPTKHHFRDNSQIDWIENGMWDLITLLRNDAVASWPVNSVAIPALGCGLGNLQWPEVLQVISTHVKSLPDVAFKIYAPHVSA